VRLRKFATRGDLPNVKDLLERKAKPDDEPGVTFDINAQNRHNGFTALHWACQNSHVEVVAALLAAKANFTLLDSHNRTCRDIAALKIPVNPRTVWSAVRCAVLSLLPTAVVVTSQPTQRAVSQQPIDRGGERSTTSQFLRAPIAGEARAGDVGGDSALRPDCQDTGRPASLGRRGLSGREVAWQGLSGREVAC
jgi:hypothetical protein